MTTLQTHLQVIYWKINFTYQLLEIFAFFTEKDPLGGYANYVDQKTAEDEGLFKFLDHKSVYIGVDASNQSDADGRKTIRLHSKKRYNHGLGSYARECVLNMGSVLDDKLGFRLAGEWRNSCYRW